MKTHNLIVTRGNFYLHKLKKAELYAVIVKADGLRRRGRAQYSTCKASQQVGGLKLLFCELIVLLKHQVDAPDCRGARLRWWCVRLQK